MCPIFNKEKLSIQDVLNSCFFGSISFGDCFHLIAHYWISILFGFFAELLTSFLSNILSDKLRILGCHDTTNTIFYSGIPDFLGDIFTPIFVRNMRTWIENKQKKIVYQYIGNFSWLL